MIALHNCPIPVRGEVSVDDRGLGHKETMHYFLGSLSPKIRVGQGRLSMISWS